MRVRILKPVATAYGGFIPGKIADVPYKVGRDWCEAGIAMQDKSLDGAPETKTTPRKSNKGVKYARSRNK